MAVRPTRRFWFALLGGALLALLADQSTKRWAIHQLAGANHPLVFTVAAERDRSDSFPASQQTLLDWMCTFLSRCGSEGEAFILRHVRRVAPDPVIVDSHRPYQQSLLAAGYVVLGAGAPPRDQIAIHLRHASLMEGWLVRALPDVPRAKIRDAILSDLAELTLADFLPPAPWPNRFGLPAGVTAYAFGAAGALPDPHAPTTPGERILLTSYEREAVPNFLRWSYAENSGVAGGLFSYSAHGGAPLALALVAIALVFICAWWCSANHQMLESTLAVSLIGAALGGAASNAVDRIRLGFVVDFAQLRLGGWEWTTINLADVCIVIGAIAGGTALSKRLSRSAATT